MPNIHMRKNEIENPHLGILYAANSMIIVCKLEVCIGTKKVSEACALNTYVDWSRHSTMKSRYQI